MAAVDLISGTDFVMLVGKDTTGNTNIPYGAPVSVLTAPLPMCLPATGLGRAMNLGIWVPPK